MDRERPPAPHSQAGTGALHTLTGTPALSLLLPTVPAPWPQLLSGATLIKTGLNFNQHFGVTLQHTNLNSSFH
jgi:hypothetical protein